MDKKIDYSKIPATEEAIRKCHEKMTQEEFATFMDNMTEAQEKIYFEIFKKELKKLDVFFGDFST